VRFTVCVMVWLLVGCPSSNSIVCPDGFTCPQGTVCIAATEQTPRSCAPESAVTACEALDERAPCMTSAIPDGTCHGGICQEASCGNGRLDHPLTVDETTGEMAGEVCDDGNNLDADGCSGNCTSEELCGNGIVDVGNSELCDDGNLLDHDDCSSACQDESARWLAVRDPGPISQVRAVYDAARGKVVMFGGKMPSGYTNATSEWRGYWTSNIKALAPLPRAGADACCADFAMAYDHANRRTVLVGGTYNGSSQNEVWGWDGVAWSRLADAPARLSDLAMAYDAKRKRIVAFGGRVVPAMPADVRAETWELDGATWTKTTPASSPTPRYGAAMGFDPKRGRIVMYGGRSADATALNELWEYDGTTWTQPLPSLGLAVLTNATLAYDTRTQRMAIHGANGSTTAMYFWTGTQLTAFGGAVPNAASREGAAFVEDGNGRLMLYGGEDVAGSAHLGSQLMWFFDGNAWEEGLTAPALIDAPIVAIPNRGVIVRFGGRPTGSGAQTNETWELSRLGWKRFSTGNPPALNETAMVYDSARDEIVLFGGLVGSVTQNVMWKRKGTTWSPITPSGDWPAARTRHGMVYDSARSEVVMFGGNTFSTGDLDDTWIWNGTAWAPRTPLTKPPKNSDFGLGFDPVNGVTIMFGGASGFIAGSADTWIWDGTNWNDLTSQLDRAPITRFGGTLTWNPGRRTLVLTQEVAGITSPPPLLDTWEWRTTSTSPLSGRWTTLPTVAQPPQRVRAGVFTTLDGSGITLYGGQLLGDTNATSEQWELRFDVPSVQDSCELPVDVDGDGKTRCGADGDPDCWPVCTPDCPPGVTCAATLPRCGDGVCGVIESCQSCPQDCTSCNSRCGDFACDPGESCEGDCP
jgi:cysteine-rich repeat protein